MRKETFALFNFVLAVLMMTGFFAFQHKFSGIDELRLQLAQTQQALEDETAQKQIALYQLEEFRQTVASHVPGVLKENDNYAVRTIASLSLPPEEELRVRPPSDVFKEAKQRYLDGKGNQARLRLQNFIEDYPMHPSVIEAHFLLTKSLYDSGEYEQSLRYVDLMVKRYPHHELTGYALMLSAERFLAQERYKDAEYIYRMIRKNFGHHKELSLEAQKYLEQWGI